MLHNLFTHTLYVCSHITLQISTPSLSPKVPKKNPETSFETCHYAHEQTCTGTTNIIPGVDLSSFTCLLEAVNHFSEVKIKILITKQQQQHRLNDFIKRVIPLKNVQSDSNCTRRTPPITTSYTDNSGRHKQTPYSLHKAAVQSVFYLNCKRWQRKKLVFSSTRSSSVAPSVWSFCGTP